MKTGAKSAGWFFANAEARKTARRELPDALWNLRVSIRARGGPVACELPAIANSHHVTVQINITGSILGGIMAGIMGGILGWRPELAAERQVAKWNTFFW
jgi:hypothetical protein